MGGGGGQQESKMEWATALDIQTSVYGMAIPIIYGKCRIAPNMIWYGDFIGYGVESSGGGKGGSEGGATNEQNYRCALMLGLCEGPIDSVTALWKNDAKNTSPSTQWTIKTGAYAQAAWTYLTNKHKKEELGYSGLALMARNDVQLGDTASLPNYNVEILGVSPYNKAGSIYDANPKDIITDLLSNAYYGAGFPSAKLDLADYSTYCQATGSFLSLAISQQQSAAQWIKQILESTNSQAVWSGGKLKVVPLYDAGSVTANGQTYTPSLAAQYAITSGDIKEPIRLRRKSPQDQYNHVQVEYVDRSRDYNVCTVEAKDDGHISNFGLRTKEPVRLHGIMTASQARIEAQLLLQREISISNEFEFTLSPRFCLLEPLDIISITDVYLGLSALKVRITQINETSEGDFEVRAEELQEGSHWVTGYSSQGLDGYVPDSDADPGNAYTPVIFEPPPAATDGRKEIWIATCGPRVAAPTSAPTLAAGTAGASYVPIGTWTYKVLYRTIAGITALGPASSSIVLSVAGKVNLSAVPVSSDPEVLERYIYRKKSTESYYKYVGTIYNNTDTTFVDDVQTSTTQESDEDGVTKQAWGGCDVWISRDNATYQKVATIRHSARIGEIFGPSALPTSTNVYPTPDASGTCNVELANDDPTSSSQLTTATTEERDRLDSLCWLDGEFIAFLGATLYGTRTKTYTLGAGIQRGIYGSTVSAHAVGSKFCRIDDAVCKIPYDL